MKSVTLREMLVIGCAIGISLYAWSGQLSGTPAWRTGLIAVPAVQDLTSFQFRPREGISTVVLFENQGRTPITVVDVDAGCSCTTVATEPPLPAIVSPGSKGVTCVLHIRPTIAEQDQQLNVKAKWRMENGEGHESVCQVKLRVLPRLVTRPAIASFRATADGVPASVTLPIMADRRNPVDLTKLRFQTPNHVTVELIAGDSNGIPEAEGAFFERIGTMKISIDRERLTPPFSKSIKAFLENEVILETQMAGYEHVSE